MFDILLDDFVLISIVPEKTFQVFLLLNSALASLFQPQEAHKGIFQKKKKKVSLFCLPLSYISSTRDKSTVKI